MDIGETLRTDQMVLFLKLLDIQATLDLQEAIESVTDSTDVVEIKCQNGSVFVSDDCISNMTVDSDEATLILQNIDKIKEV